MNATPLHKQTLRLFFFLSLALLAGCSKQNDDPAVHSDAPEVTVETLDDPSPGHIIAAPFNNTDPNSGRILVLDEKGNILETHKTEAQVLNVERWNINGQTRYSYVMNDVNGYHINGIGYVPGFAVITDDKFNELQRYYLLPYNGRTATDPNVLDSHDFILLGDNHYIAMSYYPKTVTNIPATLNPAPAVKVVCPIIQEVNNGNVVWEWQATDYPELYEASVEGNHFYSADSFQDYAHMNSMFLDPKDNNLILSFRNLNMIMKIKRQTGEIIWRLGGPKSDFALTPEMQSLRQHHATLTDDGQTLLVFDNGQIDERPQTRILEYQLDEAGKTVTGFKATPVPTNLFSGYMGSVQKLGDRYFMGGGSTPYAAEFDRSTGKIYFKMNMKQNSYRVFKYN